MIEARVEFQLWFKRFHSCCLVITDTLYWVAPFSRALKYLDNWLRINLRTKCSLLLHTKWNGVKVWSWFPEFNWHLAAVWPELSWWSPRRYRCKWRRPRSTEETKWIWTLNEKEYTGEQHQKAWKPSEHNRSGWFLNTFLPFHKSGILRRR